MRPPPSKPTAPAAPSYRSGPRAGLRGATLRLSSKTRLGGELSLHVGGGAQPESARHPCRSRGRLTKCACARSERTPHGAPNNPQPNVPRRYFPSRRQLPHVC